MGARGVLDNVVWEALNGAHRKFSSGTDTVRRYARGFSPIIGFLDNSRPDFVALEPLCDEGEKFYTAAWSGALPPGWRAELESTMYLMVWEGRTPPEIAVEAVPLRAEHAQRAVDLAVLTRPGPFGLRTIELGEYVGCLEGDRLMAMAGERMQAGLFHEISGVATHPDFQGRGLARALMTMLIRRQLARGETPFLHVMRANDHARALYERMGFRIYRESVVRVITRNVIPNPGSG